jgi:hypothetical protein
MSIMDEDDGDRYEDQQPHPALAALISFFPRKSIAAQCHANTSEWSSHMIKNIVAGSFLVLASSTANAVDYFNAKITGVGLSTTGDYMRFTIDKDPNVVLTTEGFTGEQLKRVSALIMSSYMAESPVFFVRSSESTSSTTRHYAQLLFLSVGTQTWD